MARLILINALLFALPFALYAGWVWFTKRAGPDGLMAHAPHQWLALSGLGLIAIVFFVFGSLTGSDPEGVYVPAEYRDGVIVPGRIVPPEELAKE